MRPLLMLLLIILCASNQSCSTSLNPVLVHRIIQENNPPRIIGLRHSTELQRMVAVKSAQELLNGKLEVDGLRFEPDPIGFVRAAWWKAGVDLFSAKEFINSELTGMEILYRSATARKGLFREHPQPGDLVFLGPPKSEEQSLPTQVALVEFVDLNGTVYALGRFAEGPARICMNFKNDDKNSEAMVTSVTTASSTKMPMHRLFWAFARPY